ncbi:MmcQ/YjbR family DNA-binding protein [Microbacterium proteolyticum]|uniref:MmcQ/YjbR family DNA-binding protein n=1 Tax=Microbacterium proteolyticum TaxID=1572644 RepID=UPI001FAC5039|nr:MmcQ/YjbR family DNA-binding protein [Microbacterium proteolyticum]
MVDRDAMARGREIFDPIAERQCELPGVDIGRMFGTEGLRVRGKVYAFIVHNGSLVVKLPEERIGEIVDEGVAAPMIMRGRPLRKWAEVPLDAGADRWQSLIDEARAFVDEITP